MTTTNTSSPGRAVFAPGQWVRVVCGPDEGREGMVTGTSIGGVRVCPDAGPHHEHLTRSVTYWPHELEHLDGWVRHVPVVPVAHLPVEVATLLCEVAILAAGPVADPRLRAAWLTYTAAARAAARDVEAG